MLVNVAQQLKANIGSVHKYDVNEQVDVAGGSGVVRGELQLVRTDRSILVKGSLDAEMMVECSRCLGRFSCHLPLKVEEEYFPVTDVDTGVRLPPPEDSDSFTIDERHIIDLTEALRQYVLMAIPMKPLCRESCAGLCPRCGKNLNQGRCDCPTEEIDSRWAVLKEISFDNENKVNEHKGTE